MLCRSSHGFNLFATSGINETKILLGRRYRGCSIYINKKLNCSSRLLYCDCELICPVLSVFHYLSILFVAIYMYGDMLSNIDAFNFVLSSIHALQQLYLPDHVFMELIGMLIFHALIFIHLHFLSFVLRNN